MSNRILLKWKAGWIALSSLLFIVNISNAQSSIQERDSCTKLFEWNAIKPSSEFEYNLQRDTLMQFIESCANSENSHLVFKTITLAVSYSDKTDTMRYNKYRNWLLSVAFLNTTNPYYYCACVDQIIYTYQYGPYDYTNAPLAVMRFLLDTPNCNDQGLRDFYDNTIKSRHQTWLEGDTTIAEDTTFPSLDSIDLGLLLHHSSVSPSTHLPSTYLASFLSSPNPFKDETRLHFHLNRMSYVSIEITDLLGRVVWESKGHSYDEGDHELSVDGKSLPDGTLYARISTGFGEVKTVKIIKSEP